MPRNTTRYYPQTTLYNGLTLHLVCHRPARGERILLITNRTDLKQVLALYGQRWAIETTFACLKSRGFNLEDTHMNPQRIHLLLGLLAWTLLWALLMGENSIRKPSPLKKHGRPAISLFRRGLDSPRSYTKCVSSLNMPNNINPFYCRVLRICSNYLLRSNSGPSYRDWSHLTIN